MPLTACTLTGLDEKCSLSKVVDLSYEFPFVEWGLLYSPKREGEPGRFPSIGFLKAVLTTLPLGIRTALHICGTGVSDLASGESKITDLVHLVEERQGRIQLNFNLSRKRVPISFIEASLMAYSSISFITQHNKGNKGALESLRSYANHSILFDQSGGRGLSPSEWPTPIPGIQCGFAGGLGPDNLSQQIENIEKISYGHQFWVDMEGKLRDTNDLFCLSSARDCLAQAKEYWIESKPS